TSEERANLLGVDPHGLVNAIQLYLQSPTSGAEQNELAVPEGLSLDLLQHISAAWGDISERSFQRTPTKGSMTICIDMSALHYFWADRRTFVGLLKRLDATRSAVFQLHNGAPDVWAVACDAQEINEDGVLPSDCIEYVRPVIESTMDEGETETSP